MNMHEAMLQGIHNATGPGAKDPLSHLLWLLVSVPFQGTVLSSGIPSVSFRNATAEPTQHNNKRRLGSNYLPELHASNA